MTEVIEPQAAPSPASTFWVPLGPPPSVLQAPNYGTTLPASPVDRQEAILVDNPANPNFQWRFRYNAGSTSPYKWEFIGGQPFLNASNSFYAEATVTALATWVTVGPNQTGGPTVPRTGEYVVTGCVSGLRNAGLASA